jgi:glycopeptide antibiotics resistance protein
MINEWIEKIRYFAPELFSEEDRLIFMVVMTMIVILPVLLCFLRRKPLVRGTALIIFAVYVLGNLSFTLLGREGRGSTTLPAFGNYRQAFSLDLGFKETLKMLPEGLGETLQYVHIGSRNAAREVFLNILLYIPMGYLLPFIIKPMRYSIIACTAVGFICSVATEYAQLNYGLGYFQLDDILNNTLGCFIGAMLGCTLARLWRTK